MAADLASAIFIVENSTELALETLAFLQRPI